MLPPSQTQLALFKRLFGRSWLFGEWRCLLTGPGYRPRLLYRPQLPPRPAADPSSALPPVRLRTRMTRAAAIGVIVHSIVWLAGVFVVLSFTLPSPFAVPCCCCCMLSIVAGGLLLSAHALALPVLLSSHAACVALCLRLRNALAGSQDSSVARWCSEAFLCAHLCVLLLLLLQGRTIVNGVQPQLAAAAV